MDSPVVYAVEDRDLDDAALWAVIDSAAAASMSSSSSSSFAAATTKPGTKLLSPIPFPIPSPQPKLPAQTGNHQYNYNQNSDGEVVQNHRFDKISRTSTTPRLSDASSPQPMMVKYAQPPPITPPAYISNSPKRRALDLASYQSPNVSEVSYEKAEMSHCLATQFPTVALFKEYQKAAMAILEKSDYSIISGNTYIKKSGWRKISFYFNLSYEIKDKTIEFDENRNVQRAEFVVRAYMHGGRFSDGWGSCERREKRFMKPNHDIPCTAETRAKNRACQELLRSRDRSRVEGRLLMGRPRSCLELLEEMTCLELESIFLVQRMLNELANVHCSYLYLVNVRLILSSDASV